MFISCLYHIQLPENRAGGEVLSNRSPSVFITGLRRAPWACASTCQGERERMLCGDVQGWCGRIGKMAPMNHVSLCPSYCDFEALPIKGGNLLPHPLKLSWTWDMCRPIECGGHNFLGLLSSSHKGAGSIHIFPLGAQPPCWRDVRVLLERKAT